MLSNRSSTSRRTALTVAVAGLLAAGTASHEVSATSSSPALPSVPAVSGAEAVYIVQLAEPPVVAYDGGVRSMPATRANDDRPMNPRAASVRTYVAYLESSQRGVAARVGAQPLYHYRYSFNGFAARIDAAEAERLRGSPGVVAVTESELMQLDTVTTVDSLGLSGPGGVWAGLGGTGQNGAGEGVIVGVIDSGVTPGSASFSDPDPDGNAYDPPDGWSGACQSGAGAYAADFGPSDCSNKLVGARYFLAGFGGVDAVLDELPYESISPLDVDGHGTHVASTAAGNFAVPAVVGGFDFGTMSGMAPRAHVAVYKVCWGSGNEGGCHSADGVAAIDQAVADGVDVINYSISGSRTTSLDPVEQAFMAAADAGVFIATSAGNEGDTDLAGSVAHASPWVTTVAAATQPRTTTATLTLGNSVEYEGVSLSTATVGPVDLVSSVDVGLGGADAEDVRLCALGSLDPALVGGKIVLCQRGVVDRVEKSAEVAAAGGLGMVLANVAAGTLNADAHSVPSVHLPHTDFASISGYIASAPTPTATIGAAVVANGIAGFEPALAAFSSFGPSPAHGGDVLKPDITAPGVDIVASVSPLNGGATVGLISGTSMSSPHIAGIAALLIDHHPDWSPMMIKSAMMTTAEPFVGSDGVHDELDSFDYGSGYVAPSSAVDPGLVYDSTFPEWAGFLCGGELGPSACVSNAIPVLDPSNLNVPSISIGSLGSKQTITRTVTNVGPAGTYAASAAAPAGFDVVVDPPELTLGTGQSATFAVSFTVDHDEVTYGTFTHGSLVWTDGSHHVYSPIVVKAEQVGAPAAVVAPVFSDQCGVDQDTVTLADVTGVSYTINSEPVPPGTSMRTGTIVVTVTADEGFFLVGEDDYQFEFTDVPCPSPPPIIAVPPGRFLDTREAPSAENAFATTGKLTGGSITAIKIAGRGSVPDGATGVIANLTAIAPDAPGFATLYPCSPTPPTASTVNYLPGDVVANTAIVPLDADGEVCLYTLGAADFALDVTGYVPSGSDLVGLNPQRYLDTRASPDAPTFDALASAVGRLVADGVIEVQIAGRGGVPANAASAVVNLTAIAPDAPGFLTLYSCGDRPTASTVNYFANQFVPNGAVIELSDTGTVCVYSSASAGVALDVSGWLPETEGLTPAAPARFLDTRPGADNPTVDGASKGAGPLGAGQVMELQITGRNGVPTGATAVLLNLAVVFPAGPGFATVYPCGPVPNTSTVNHTTGGTVRANNAVSALSPSGTVCIFTLATTDVIVDVSGWTQ
ncbi:MAG TPA: S8 family peptidase [Ilumatobacter sp.]|nr:S8 family peptidase [Ilumatobacter sp.]